MRPGHAQGRTRPTAKLWVRLVWEDMGSLALMKELAALVRWSSVSACSRKLSTVEPV